MRAQPGSAEDAIGGVGGAHSLCSAVPAEGSGEMSSTQRQKNVQVAQTPVKSGP